MERFVVVITGAGQGLGKSMAKHFAEKGYIVVATDVIDASFDEENIQFVQANLNSEEELKAVFDFAKDNYGPVHILVNNGAISKFHADINTITVEEFKEVISVNLTGSFICAKEFVSANKGADFGRIINIASTRWHQNESGWEAYGASKGGIVSLTNTLCVSLADTPITVNAISPGWIETSAYDKLTATDHQQHPSGRVGKPDDIARTALFLADEKNDFINGANIMVDGGMTKKMIYQNSNDFWN